MTQIHERLPAQRPAPQETAQDMGVFVANLEVVVSPSGVATGDTARKVGELDPRFLGYEFRDYVLPQQPDPEFVEYIEDLAQEDRRILVPDGINMERLSILDGMGDPRIPDFIRGRRVESYINHQPLFEVVSRHGGVYNDGKAPGDAVAWANNKGVYREHAYGVVDVPPGELIGGGVDNIARAVKARLDRGRGTVVRHVLSGGGIGNRFFLPDASGPTDIRTITEKIVGGNPDLWNQSAEALVEDLLDLWISPGVAFNTKKGIIYDYLQTTFDGDFWGSWSPMPRVPGCTPEMLDAIGEHLADRLRAGGFDGDADTDLGITHNGEVYGFEINGRKDGLRHAVLLAERLRGPWRNWRNNGTVMKSMDHMVMPQQTPFRQVKRTLAEAGLLASRENPRGVIISIPPADGIVGIVVVGDGYKQVQEMYDRVVATIGDPAVMKREDHPLSSIIELK